MDRERVEEMLTLARLKRTEGISESGQKRLDALRQEYLRDFREGFARQLEQVYIQQPDGSYQKLRRREDADDVIDADDEEETDE